MPEGRSGESGDVRTGLVNSLRAMMERREESLTRLTNPTGEAGEDLADGLREDGWSGRSVW